MARRQARQPVPAAPAAAPAAVVAPGPPNSITIVPPTTDPVTIQGAGTQISLQVIFSPPNCGAQVFYVVLDAGSDNPADDPVPNPVAITVVGARRGTLSFFVPGEDAGIPFAVQVYLNSPIGGNPPLATDSIIIETE